MPYPAFLTGCANLVSAYATPGLPPATPPTGGGLPLDRLILQNDPNTDAPDMPLVGSFPLTKQNYRGDFIAAGAGTRKFGTGRIHLFLPKNAEIDEAYLIINTYVSNNIIDPSSSLPYTLQRIGTPPGSNGPLFSLCDSGCSADANCYAWCNSTCWINPGPQLSTYLRNRIYVFDVYPLLDGSGIYEVGGLPFDITQAIGIDSDRVPGCCSSQGAVLYVIYKLPKTGNDKTEPKLKLIQTWIGASLLSNNVATWGGALSKLSNFNLTLPPGSTLWAGNSKITLAAGDTQTSVAGDKISINSTRFNPLNNAFQKIGSSLSIVTQRIGNLYAGSTNSSLVETSNDCVAWFLFAISTDSTIPKADFYPVECSSTILSDMSFVINVAPACGVGSSPCIFIAPSTGIDATQTQIIVKSNESSFIAGCTSSIGADFPNAPFYIIIDKEIMLVTSKDYWGNKSPVGGPVGTFPIAYFPDPSGDNTERVWTVVRGYAGTTAVEHTIIGLPSRAPNVYGCVRLMAPTPSKSAQQAALVKRGKPQQRTAPPKVNSRVRRGGR